MLTPCVSLGGSRRAVFLRRFHFSAARHKNLSTSFTCELSDHEWTLRTGRTIDILVTTLPNFFANGLTSQIDIPPSSLPGAHLTGANPSADRADSTHQEVPLYSPSIRLEYTHPMFIPAPLPQNLHVEGLPLYLASAMFVRHTLNALYADLGIELCMLRRWSPSHVSSHHHPRELRISLGLLVTGRARVTGQLAEWQINSTYFFEPTNALISRHVIDSILPAPHDTALELLRRALDTASAGLIVSRPAAGRLGMRTTGRWPRCLV
ncbi:hypothetical protein BJV78DRAFT_1129890 [Lactifluus subvellereus]|nr:hypothetical protein BJV78DRAFT_1129890 [Lactifluus subvellereus]